MKRSCIKPVKLVKPAEVIKISMWHRTSADSRIALEIAEAFDKEYIGFLKESSRFYRMCLFTAIWNGGRIQGIREERQRRKSS